MHSVDRSPVRTITPERRKRLYRGQVDVDRTTGNRVTSADVLISQVSLVLETSRRQQFYHANRADNSGRTLWEKGISAGRPS
jgi:hypothetical protein